LEIFAMSKNQQIVFVALPHGMTDPGTSLRVTAFVSPRLTPAGPNGTLAEFPSFLNWPEIIARTSFSVTLDGATTLPATVTSASLLRADLWRELFSSTTPVRPFQPARYADIRSFQVRPIHQYLQQTYREVARTHGRSSPTLSDQGPPGTLGDLVANVGPVHRFADRSETLIRQQGGDPGAIDGAIQNPLAREFYRMRRFYRWPGTTPPDPPPPVIPDLDFHGMLTYLTDHTALLRALGLAIDLTIPRALGMADLGTVQVVANGPYGGSDDAPAVTLAPKTHYVLTNRGFCAQSKDGESGDIQQGMLQLQRPDLFEVSTMEVDGSGLKTLDFASTMAQQMEAPNDRRGAEEPLPALRNGGISVSRVGRADRVKALFARVESFRTAPAAMEYYAEDLTRGYRVDVDDGVWRSLCLRTATYAIGASGSFTDPADEGFIRGGTGTKRPHDPDHLYLHETIFGWDGWSLTVPKPGRKLVRETNEATGVVEDAPREELPKDDARALALRPKLAVKAGSLPRLRYGTSYRFRARAVDLAGNSVAAGSDDRNATPPIHHGRWEPIAPPALVMSRRVTEGESLEHIVVRSDRGMSPEAYSALPDSVARGYSNRAHRHVAPPKAAQYTCELHGAFDAIVAGENGREKAYRVALKEEGTFLDRSVVDTGTGELAPLANVELVDGPMTPPDRRGVWPARKGDPLGAGQYVIHTGRALTLPYLPEPMVIGFTVQSDEGSLGFNTRYAGTALMEPHGFADWPNVLPMGLNVVGTSAGTEARSVSQGTEAYEMQIPQATIAKVRVSSFVDPAKLEQMALWPALDPSRRFEVALGGHAMFTPAREIVLVHAVQRPLEPAVLDPDVLRAAGSTFVEFDGTVRCHGRSTVKVEARASFRELIDDVAEPTWREHPREAIAFALAARYEDTALPLMESLPGRPGAPNVSRAARHEIGDTKHYWVNYTTRATTRYAEYFSPEITRDTNNITLEGAPLWLDIPSSAHPSAPRVAYIVPTFKWERSRDGKTRKRIGGGLRIYLERPWFSSGEDERLAVVLSPASGTNYVQLVSRWAADPVWDTTSVGGFIPASAFVMTDGPVREADGTPVKNPLGVEVARVVRATNVALAAGDGPADARVDVLAYAVEYNEERRLWYCDIDLDASGGYFPFVSLAVARYQPSSTYGAHLSPIVRADFAQLTNDRTATVSRSGRTVTLTLAGMSAGNFVEPTTRRVGGRIQTLPGAGHRVRAQLEILALPNQGDLGWRAVGAPVELTATSTGGASRLWSGTLDVGATTSKLRVVLREVEIYATDPDTAAGTLSVPSGLPGVAPTDVPYGERVIYADIFNIQ
jgi:hypothetical protein